METQEQTIQQHESIKLIKTSKGYNWEIRIIDDLNIERLEKIDLELKMRFENAK